MASTIVKMPTASKSWFIVPRYPVTVTRRPLVIGVSDQLRVIAAMVAVAAAGSACRFHKL